jgi:mRNA interferase RelE/StbE
VTRYRVELTPAAQRSLRRLDRQAQRRVQAAIDLLADEPRPRKAKALQGRRGYLRVRTGDYRIVYTVRDEVLLVLVIALGHRREVYDR